MSLLATHVGRLPRSQAVVDFLFARERGEAYDPEPFDRTMAEAVSGLVRRQVEAGIDVVSDGETSKISYATSVTDRHNGFDGDSPRNAPASLKLFPSCLERSRSRAPPSVRAHVHSQSSESQMTSRAAALSTIQAPAAS